MCPTLQSHRAEILAANPNLLSHPDPKFFKICASLFWKEQLTDEERQRFRDMAAEERRKAKEALAAMEASDPQFKARREKELEYKKAKQQEASAARATNGPLWAAQKRKTTAQRRSTPKPRRPKLRIVRKKRPSKNLNGIKRSKARREAAAAADAKEADVDESDMSDGGSDLESEELMEEFSEEEAEEDMEPRPAPYPEDMEQDEAEVPAEAKAPVKSAKEVKKSGVGYTDEFELPSESAPSVPVARVTRNKVAKPNVPLETEKKKQTLKKRR